MTKETEKKNGKKTGKKTGGRQAELTGFERPKIAEIEEAALSYVEARDARLHELEKEKDRKAILTQRLEEFAGSLECDDAGQPVYVFNDGTKKYTVTLESVDVKPKVKSESIEAV